MKHNPLLSFPTILQAYGVLRIILLLVLFPLLFPFPVLAQVPLSINIVGFSGAEEHLQNNVLQFLDISRMKGDKELTIHGVKRLHKQAPQEIREALQPYGYYIPDIQSELVEKNGDWTATYTIKKGEPVRIRNRDVQWFGEGSDQAPFQQSIKEYLAGAGAILVHTEHEAAKNAFMNMALSSGYPKAKFLKTEWLIDLDTNSADLTLHMDTGPLYYFGDITFKQDFLDPDLLEKYNTIKKGTPYSYDTLLDFQQNLLASNYAKEVTIAPLYNKAIDQQLPLDVILKPISPHKFAFGIGYDSDTGVRGSARWDDRLINRYGHHSEVRMELAETEGVLRAQYNIPVVRPLTDRWVSSTSFEYDQTSDTKSTTFETETAFVRRNLSDTFFYKGFLLASVEAFSVEGEQDEETILFSIGGTFRFAEMEESLFPQSGHYFFSDLRGASEALLSDTSYARLHLKNRYMLGLGENGRIDTSLEIGTSWVEDFDMYPTSLRFFAGGDNSVRGYRYESLGPVNDNGVSVGGKNIVTGSFEYDHRLAHSWVLSAFVDAGNAYNDTIDTLYVGAGVGFRWLAPFGSLRVDIAYPVSEEPELDDFRIHIGFGATL